MDEPTAPVADLQKGSYLHEGDTAVARPPRPAGVFQLTLSNGGIVSTCVDGMQPHCEEVLKFEMRQDDVTVITYPKSGTTWVQEIVWLICNDADVASANASSLFQRYGLLDMPDIPDYAVFRGLQALKSWPSNKRRFIKTHLPFRAQPLEQQEKARGKMFYVVRNPKDTCVSFYHMHRMMHTAPDPGTWSEFLDKFISGDVMYGSWFDHVSNWWQIHRERRDSVYFVSYESLKKDLKSEVRKMASFLETNLSDKQIDGIVEHCSFGEMSKNDNTNWSEYQTHGIMDFNVSKFMRKGEVGDWKNYFTVSQNEAFDEMMKTRFKDIDLNLTYEII